MDRVAIGVAVVLGFLSIGRAAEPPQSSQPLPAFAATARRGMVATVHPLATQAGVDALSHGGNAIDAAVAAALTLGVVDGNNSGIGGGCFLLAPRAGRAL